MDEGTPVKLCECGCGEPAPIATETSTARGHVKGQPLRFVMGHARRGRVGPFRNPDGYDAIHTWLLKHFTKSGICEECGRSAKTDFALTKGRGYSRNREDYRELCRRCHVHYDTLGTHRSPESIARMSAASRASWERDRQAGIVRNTARGEQRGLAKLTDAAVVEIRRAREQGVPLAELAARYGVGYTTLWKAATGRTWAHITEGLER